jgi:hypothetical protein
MSQYETVRIISFTEKELKTLFVAVSRYKIESDDMDKSERLEALGEGVLFDWALESFIADKLAS